jgi:hypothetical protein
MRNGNGRVLPITAADELFGFSYAEVAAKLLRLFGIADAISGPIHRQHIGLTEAEIPDDMIMQPSSILVINNAGEEHNESHRSISAEVYERL